MLLIKDIMSSSPVIVEQSATVLEAKQLMSRYSVRHLPVVAGGKLVGILTDRDLKLAQAVTKDIHFDESHTVGDTCVRDIYVVKSTEPASTVLAYLAKERIGSALVTEENKLAGIFTVTDACKAFAEYLRRHDRDTG